jgi:hypothetical protein
MLQMVSAKLCMEVIKNEEVEESSRREMVLLLYLGMVMWTH